MVGWCTVWVEAWPRGYVDRFVIKILVVVGSKWSENLHRWKGKGSLAMQISQGLADPNRDRNWLSGKGKLVNIPVLLLYMWQHKPCFWLFGIDRRGLSSSLINISLWSIVTMRRRLKLRIAALSFCQFLDTMKKKHGGSKVIVPRTNTGAPRWVA